MSIVHPPLAKWLIAAGIRLFGYTPTGWRVAPFVAGTLSIALVYLLAHRLFRSTLTASLASGLLAFDLLYFVMSRAAMLDVFVVFFSLVMFLGFVYDRGTENLSGSRRRLRNRPWLIVAGLAGGAATASKWSGGYLLIAVIILAVADSIAQQRGTEHRLRRAASDEGAVLALTLVILPALVYVATYAGRIHGSVFAPAMGTWCVVPRIHRAPTPDVRASHGPPLFESVRFGGVVVVPRQAAGGVRLRQSRKRPIPGGARARKPAGLVGRPRRRARDGVAVVEAQPRPSRSSADDRPRRLLGRIRTVAPHQP